MSRIPIVLGALLLPVSGGAQPAVLVDDEKQVVEMTLQPRPLDGGDDLGYGTCQWLHPFDEPQEELLEQPRYASPRPVFYAARFGDSEDDVWFWRHRSESPTKKPHFSRLAFAAICRVEQRVLINRKRVKPLPKLN